MLVHSFDRFYVVTKFILPSIGDLHFSRLNYDNTCTYLCNKNTHSTETKKHILDLMTFCKKIEPFVIYYKNLINSYNNMPYNCYVRQCLLVLKIVLYFFKCLGFCMHFISLYGALSLHNCSSSGLLVFASLGSISLDCTLNNNSTDSYISYKGIYSS